ncbi:MAG: hypothetical protein AB1807_19520 [Pseudomonadota bacterium]
MNSPKLPSLQHSAPDALYDDIEQELLALTTASLDDDGSNASPTVVDEFDNEFLAELSLTETSRPPC